MSVEHAHWRDWYEIVAGTDEILQGDIFRAMRAYWLPPELPRSGEADLTALPLPFASGNWIVLSASCELARRDDVYVLIARVFEANAAELGSSSQKDVAAKLEVLRRGNDLTKFLLSDCPDTDPPFPFAFAYYRQQAFLPIKYLRAHCDAPRLRLKSPFREKFGAWAAMNLGQVGIHDHSCIPKFTRGLSATEIISAIEDTD